MTKTAPASAQPGQRFDYTLTAFNKGPDRATSVTLTDTLPAQVSFVSATGATCTGARTLKCDLGTLSFYESKTVTIRVRADAEGAAANAASISAAETDLAPDDSRAAAAAAIREPSSDLRLTATGPATAREGTQFGYSLELTNLGPDDTSAVRIHGALSAGLTLGSGSTSGCSAVAGGFQCLVDWLARDRTNRLNVYVRPNAGGSQTLTLTVTQSNSDPAPGNNQPAVTTAVTPRPTADLSLSLSEPPEIGQDETLDYTITVENDGPDDATGVVINSWFPTAAFDTESAETESGTCSVRRSGAVDASGQPLTMIVCSLSPLEPGATWTVDVSARAIVEGSYTVGARTSGSGNERDPDSDDRSASFSLAVQSPS